MSYSKLLSCLTLFVALTSCSTVPEDKSPKPAADQKLGRTGAPVRFFDLNLYLTIKDSLPEPDADVSIPISAGSRFHVSLPDSGIVRVAFFDADGSPLRVYPDSLYAVPGSYPITLSPSDTLSDSLSGGVYSCRILAGDSTFVKKLVIF